jgi:alkaline phosphatase D
MLNTVPLIYQWDDHDYGKNDSNRTSNSRQASLQNYREFIPHYPLKVIDDETPVVGAPTDQAFTVGRVRFILSDLRSRRDRETRRMMSAGQDAWLRAQLLDAKGKYPLVFWVSSVPWNGAASEADRWQGYPAHRTEIADFIKTNGITGVCVLAGDAHMVGIDDGTNSDFATGGGAPLRVFQAGPLANHGSYKGGPYSHGGNADSPPDGRLYHFGLVEVQDDGRVITVHWSGREGSDGVGDKILNAQRWGTAPLEFTFKVE